MHARATGLLVVVFVSVAVMAALPGADYRVVIWTKYFSAIYAHFDLYLEFTDVYYYVRPLVGH